MTISFFSIQADKSQYKIFTSIFVIVISKLAYGRFWSGLFCKNRIIPTKDPPFQCSVLQRP